ncbi:MAG: hypothetical protein ACI80V_002575 [Rhodothermales bacterium]
MDFTDGFVLGLTLGIGFGVIYGGVSFFTYRVALRRSYQTFMVVAFGGMVARLFIALTAITLVIVFVAVDLAAFVSSFFAVFAIALTIEVVMLHRQQTRQLVQRS